MHRLNTLVHHAVHAKLIELAAVATRSLPKLVTHAARGGLRIQILPVRVSLVVPVVVLEEVLAHHGCELVVRAHGWHLRLLLWESL